MLEPGDRAPQFLLKDLAGRARTQVENRIAGKPVILLFDNATADFEHFAKEVDVFQDHDTTLFVISAAEPNDRLAKLSERLTVVLDERGATHRRYGCETPAVCVLDLDSRLIDIYLATGTPQDIERALAGVSTALKVAPEATLSMHAPVLVIPRALDPDTCRKVMDAWEQLERQPIEARGAKRNAASSAFFDTYGHVRQHVLRDKMLLSDLDQRLPRRLGLEIRKAFQTSISRREDYRIACYEGTAGGSLAPHRDNMTKATEHRRFTASIQLNTGDYAGGELRFPEYGRQLYRGPTGTAIVFSASLLHEVLPVTNGRRFMLGTHLFGD